MEFGNFVWKNCVKFFSRYHHKRHRNFNESVCSNRYGIPIRHSLSNGCDTIKNVYFLKKSAEGCEF